MHPATASDDLLLGFGRRGDHAALTELYRRHRSSAVRYARHLAWRQLGPDAAEDVVAEAMHNTLRAISRGKGPLTGFRPYLFTAIQRVVTTACHHRAAQLRLAPALATEMAVPSPDDDVSPFVAMEAFATLPRRWQKVAWSILVRDLSTEQAADELGLSEDTVTSIVTRAREALRVAFVRSHLPTARDPACSEALDLLARRLATRLSPAQRRRLSAHLDGCTACSGADVLLELDTPDLPTAARTR